MAVRVEPRSNASTSVLDHRTFTTEHRTRLERTGRRCDRWTSQPAQLTPGISIPPGSAAGFSEPRNPWECQDGPVVESFPLLCSRYQTATAS